MEDTPKPTRSNPKKSAVHKLRSETQLRADAARSEANKRAWNPERRKRKSEAMKRIWADPEVHKRRSEANKRTAADPEVHKRRSEANKRTAADPEVRKLKSQATKRTWKNPEVHKRRIEGMKRALANPEVQKRMSEGNKRAWANPERRKRTSEATKRAWANPERRKRRIKAIKRALANPEEQKRRSEWSKRAWAERRSKLAAALPADWDRKPFLSQIIGNQLLLRHHVTNKEIARQLDSISLPCPYPRTTNAPAKTWQFAVNDKGFLQLMRRIRIWVRRPGRTLKPGLAA